MGRILLAFILIPVVELYLLIEIGRYIGPLATIGLIIATGTLGAWLVRRQGLSVLNKIQTETASGRLPADAMVDGIIILIAGAVLLTPGVLTDLFGFACLIPTVRELVKARLKKRFEGRVQTFGQGGFTAGFGGAAPRGGRSEMRDITPTDSAG